MSAVDVANTIRTLATIVRLHEGNRDAAVNALLDRADSCCAAVTELIAERDRLANIVSSHEAQFERMKAEFAELIEADRAYESALAAEAAAEADGDDDLICNAARQLQWAKDRHSAALARIGGAA